MTHFRIEVKVYYDGGKVYIPQVHKDDNWKTVVPLMRRLFSDGYDTKEEAENVLRAYHEKNKHKILNYVDYMTIK